jgi:hypothetical protein
VWEVQLVGPCGRHINIDCHPGREPSLVPSPCKAASSCEQFNDVAATGEDLTAHDFGLWWGERGSSCGTRELHLTLEAARGVRQARLPTPCQRGADVTRWVQGVTASEPQPHLGHLRVRTHTH